LSSTPSPGLPASSGGCERGALSAMNYSAEVDPRHRWIFGAQLDI
jgi:hypothetical protein